LKNRIKKANEVENENATQRILFTVNTALFNFRDFIFPLTNVVLLGVAVAVSDEFFEAKWLVQFVQGVNFLSILYIAAIRSSTSAFLRYFAGFVLSPIIVL
jgi:hypothetical protein